MKTQTQSWPLREALAKREYPPLPSHLVHLLNHPYFVHISKADRTCWAYTPTPEHGEQDRQVRLAPGKMLKRITNLKDHEIRDIVEDYTKYLAVKFPVYELEWATTRGAVQSVYENSAPEDMQNAFGESVEEGEPLNDVCAEGSGYPSCMGHGQGDYDGGFHPARIYGSSPDGSIAVAFVRDEKGIVARTVCSMHVKTYVRVYQRHKTEGAKHLEALLKAQGYTQKRYLVGTVAAVWYDEPERVHMPYLDWDTRFDLAYQGGDQVVIFGRDGEYENTRTDGRAEIESQRETCGCCGESVDETTWVESAQEAVCEYCLGEHYTYAYDGGYQEYVSNEDVHYCEDTEEYYTESGIEYHDLVWDSDGDLRSRDEVAWIESLDEYVDLGHTFEDGEGEVRAYQEVDLSWWLDLGGNLWENEPEGEIALELGALVVLMFWFRPRTEWDYLYPVVESGVSRRVRAILPPRNQIQTQVQTLESLARRYGVEIPDDGYPIWEGRSWKVRPETKDIFAWLKLQRELEEAGERWAEPEAQLEFALAA